MSLAGVYYVYLAQCAVILRAKVHNGMSLWLPIACFLIFLIVTSVRAQSWIADQLVQGLLTAVAAPQDFVVEMIVGYQAFSVPNGQKFADPASYFADVASKTSLAKGVLTAILAMFSDVIIVSA